MVEGGDGDEEDDRPEQVDDGEDERRPDLVVLLPVAGEDVGGGHGDLEEHVEVEDVPRQEEPREPRRHEQHQRRERPPAYPERDLVEEGDQDHATETAANVTPRASARSTMPTPAGHPPATISTGPSRRTTTPARPARRSSPRGPPPRAARPTARGRPGERARPRAPTACRPVGRQASSRQRAHPRPPRSGSCSSSGTSSLLGVVLPFQGLGFAHLGVGDILEVHGAVGDVEPVDHRQEKRRDAEGDDEGGERHRLHQRVAHGRPRLRAGSIGAAPRVRPAAMINSEAELETRIIPTTTRMRSRCRSRNAPEPKTTATTSARSQTVTTPRPFPRQRLRVGGLPLGDGAGEERDQPRRRTRRRVERPPKSKRTAVISSRVPRWTASVPGPRVSGSGPARPRKQRRRRDAQGHEEPGEGDGRGVPDDREPLRSSWPKARYRSTRRGRRPPRPRSRPRSGEALDEDRRGDDERRQVQQLRHRRVMMPRTAGSRRERPAAVSLRPPGCRPDSGGSPPREGPGRRP